MRHKVCKRDAAQTLFHLSELSANGDQWPLRVTTNKKSGTKVVRFAIRSFTILFFPALLQLLLAAWAIRPSSTKMALPMDGALSSARSIFPVANVTFLVLSGNTWWYYLNLAIMLRKILISNNNNPVNRAISTDNKSESAVHNKKNNNGELTILAEWQLTSK